MQHIIGIDIGTTHVKAIVATTACEVLFDVKESYPTLHPSPGYHEQNPETIFKAVWTVLQKAVGSVADKESIACISFSAAMHSLMAIDAEGKPLTELMTWADTRSNKFAQQLRGTSLGDRIYQLTGTPVHPMSPLCKIAWIRNEMPAIFAQAHKFISGKEYVFYQLFDEFVIDYSVASATGLFDIHQFRYCEESLAFAGISAEQLSRPVSTTHASNNLKEEYRLQLGIPAQTPFLIGGSDGYLANLGAGAVLPGELALTIGTSGAARKLGTMPVNDPKQRIFNYALDPNSYLTGGAINNGGIVLQWVIDVFIDSELPEDEKMNQLMKLASSVEAGAKGLIFLPYIYGERSPVWDAAAKGVFIGISSVHTRAHFIRAVLEGICFSLLQIVEAIEETGEAIRVIYANGGFIQSRLWLTILTSVLNKKICVSHAGDASAIGAIFLAMRSLGNIKDWGEIKDFVKTDETFDPDPLVHQLYLANYQLYKNLYAKLKDDFKTIDTMQSAG